MDRRTPPPAPASFDVLCQWLEDHPSNSATADKTEVLRLMRRLEGLFRRAGVPRRPISGPHDQARP